MFAGASVTTRDANTVAENVHHACPTILSAPWPIKLRFTAGPAGPAAASSSSCCCCWSKFTYLQLLLVCQDLHAPLFKPCDQAAVIFLQAVCCLLRSQGLLLYDNQSTTMEKQIGMGDSTNTHLPAACRLMYRTRLPGLFSYATTIAILTLCSSAIVIMSTY